MSRVGRTYLNPCPLSIPSSNKGAGRSKGNKASPLCIPTLSWSVGSRHCPTISNNGDFNFSGGSHVLRVSSASICGDHCQCWWDKAALDYRVSNAKSHSCISRLHDQLWCFLDALASCQWVSDSPFFTASTGLPELFFKNIFLIGGPRAGLI